MATPRPNGNGRKLTLAALADAKRLPLSFLRELGLTDLPDGGVGIPYYGDTSEEIAVKRRTALKAKDGSWWPKGISLAVYGLWRLDRAYKAARVVLVEGESDCWALWHHGIPALGIPGASSAKVLEQIEHLTCIEKIYVHHEPDKGGETFVAGVLDRLARLGFKGRVFELRMPDGIKDPADLHVADPEKFKARLEEAIRGSARLELPKPQARVNRVQAPETYKPFPLEALPAPLAEYVRQGALALGCDPAYMALPSLAMAAGLIGYTRVLKLKRTWRVPSVLWMLVVAESGRLKTPAFRLSTDYVFTLQKRLELEYKRKLAEYIDAKEKWDAATKAAKKGEGESPGEEPEPPVRRTVFTSDATIEAVAELIDENPRGLVVACDELAGWFGSFARYKGKAGGTDLPRWLSMHSAGGFAYHRKTGDRRRIIVPHAAVSIAGGIQPGILARAMAGDFMEAGLAARLLMVMPPPPEKKWTELEIDPDTENRYHNLLESLFGLEFDGKDPHVLRLSPEAKAAWVRWYNVWAREQAAVEGELAAAFSKIEEAAARFALVHHVVTRIDRGESDLCPVEAESVEAGVTLARWFAQEGRRVYAVLSESDEQRDLRRLVEFIGGRGGKITVRDLQRANGRKYPDAESAESALQALVEAGLGRWAEPDGTHRARVLELCPTPDSPTPDSRPVDPDSPTPSDALSDSNGQLPVFPEENGQVSDMSDCRTGTQGPLPGLGEKPAATGRKEGVSDSNANSDGPYRKDWRA